MSKRKELTIVFIRRSILGLILLYSSYVFMHWLWNDFFLELARAEACSDVKHGAWHWESNRCITDEDEWFALQEKD